MMNLENYFSFFRANIIGIDQKFISPFGEQKIVYADWTASGRIYKPIEDKLNNAINANEIVGPLTNYQGRYIQIVYKNEDNMHPKGATELYITRKNLVEYYGNFNDPAIEETRNMPPGNIYSASVDLPEPDIPVNQTILNLRFKIYRLEK